MGKIMLRQNLVIHNTSQYPDDEVKRLVVFGYEEVKKVAKREGWLRLLKRKTYLHVGNSRFAYRGRYCYQRRAWACGRGKVWKTANLNQSDWVVVIHCNLGNPSQFPIQCDDNRFKDMPTHKLFNWQEGLVMLVGHELTHHQYRGNKHGEFNCDLVGEDTVKIFRKKLGPVIMAEELERGPVAPPKPKVKRKTLRERITEKLKEYGLEEDLEDNGDGWWLYHYGWNNEAMGEACHLIREYSLQEVWRILKAGLTKCRCSDCETKETQ